MRLGLFQIWRLAGRDHESRPLLTERLGDLQPKPAGASRNERILAGEIECLLDASHSKILKLVGNVLLYGSAGYLYFPRNTAERRSTKDWMPSFMSSLLKTRSLIFGM